MDYSSCAASDPEAVHKKSQFPVKQVAKIEASNFLGKCCQFLEREKRKAGGTN